MNTTKVDFNKWVTHITDSNLLKINEWDTSKVTDLSKIGKGEVK